MHLEGEFQVATPVARVWALFRDPVSLMGCVDDPHEVRPVDASHFEGQVTTGVAFIRGTFRFRGSYAAETPMQSLRVQLSGSGMGSGMDADIAVTFSGAPTSTQVRWTAEVRMSGTIATVGERLVRGTVDKKVAGLFENARRQLAGA
jgi:uncharacterized protein